MPTTQVNVGVIKGYGSEEFDVIVETDNDPTISKVVYVVRGKYCECYDFGRPKHDDPLCLAALVIAGSNGEITEVRFEEVLEHMANSDFSVIDWEDTANLRKGWPVIQSKDVPYYIKML